MLKRWLIFLLAVSPHGGYDRVQHPYAVTIWNDFCHICGGSIISPRHVLTSGDCGQSLEVKSTRVTYGRLDPAQRERVVSRFRESTEGQIKAIYLHPQNLSALLSLNKYLIFNVTLIPATLPVSQDNAKVGEMQSLRTTCFLVNSLSERLSRIRLVGINSCSGLTDSGVVSAEHYLCASVEKTKPEEQVTGDPLICGIEQWGIMSLVGCCRTQLFVRTDTLANWIVQTMSSDPIPLTQFQPKTTISVLLLLSTLITFYI